MKFSPQLMLGFVLLISCNEVGELKPSIIPVKNQEHEFTLSYFQVKSSIDNNRISLRHEFLNLDTPQGKNALAKAGNRIRQIIGQELYGYWQGTPWDFNSTTKTPKRGSIAC